MPRSCSLVGRAHSNATRPWESLISTLTCTKRVSTRQWAMSFSLTIPSETIRPHAKDRLEENRDLLLCRLPEANGSSVWGDEKDTGDKRLQGGGDYSGENAIAEDGDEV